MNERRETAVRPRAFRRYDAAGAACLSELPADEPLLDDEPDVLEPDDEPSLEDEPLVAAEPSLDDESDEPFADADPLLVDAVVLVEAAVSEPDRESVR